MDGIPIPEIDASLGMTRKWDARDAGREVAREAIQSLKNPPTFFLLFSTIHYKDHGGFEEFIKGIWDVLPKGTPLIGGTVPGFINNYGCFARGATALAITHPQMDIFMGYGKNTKRNPSKAVQQSANMLKDGFNKSSYPHKFLFNFVSGPEVIKIPGQGYKKVVDSGLITKFILPAYGFSQYFFQKGLGREDEIFEEIVRLFPDSSMILGTAMDDNRGKSNYQFYNETILTNSIVNLGIATDLDLDVCTTHGMSPGGIDFDITKLSKNGHIIHEINNKPAVQELNRLLKWPVGFLNEKTMTHTILYYPISLRRHNREVPAVMTFILKNSILMPPVIDKGKVSILTVSGKKLVQAIQENLDYCSCIQPEFGLISTCTTILETLGYKINIVQNKLSAFFKEKPFIMFLSAGEGTYSQEKDITYANMSYNTAIFGQRKI
jgi:hypothetical protein